MWLLKYLLFFSSAIVSVVGAGAVIAGCIMFYTFNHLLPAEITSILTSAFELLQTLPNQLWIIGTVVCLSTLFGACGAILGGSVGKWLMITYTIELTVFVALNIFVASVLHVGHKKGSVAVASPLIISPNLEPILPATSNSMPVALTEDAMDKPRLRQRRDLKSFVSGIGGTLHKGASGAVGGAIHLAEGAKQRIGETAGQIGGSITDGAKLIAEKAGNAGSLAVATLKFSVNVGEFVLSLFKKLSDEEEYAVRFIRPILGMYTRPVFRLTNSKIVMTSWAIAIGIEIIFILLNIYFITTKMQYSETP